MTTTADPATTSPSPSEPRKGETEGLRARLAWAEQDRDRVTAERDAAVTEAAVLRDSLDRQSRLLATAHGRGLSHTAATAALPGPAAPAPTRRERLCVPGAEQGDDCADHDHIDVPGVRQ